MGFSSPVIEITIKDTGIGKNFKINKNPRIIIHLAHQQTANLVGFTFLEHDFKPPL